MRALARNTSVLLALLTVVASGATVRRAPAPCRVQGVPAAPPRAQDARTLLIGTPRVGSRETGAVQVLAPRRGAWRHVQLLRAPDAQEFSDFGSAVAVSGPLALVGAPLADDATGAAYLFEWRGRRWRPVAKLVPPEPSLVAGFGRSVGFDGDALVVGALQRRPASEILIRVETPVPARRRRL